MPGSLSVRKKNAQRYRENKRVTKGQSLSTYKPGTVESFYDMIGSPLAALYQRLGMDEPSAYQSSRNLGEGIEALAAPQSLERVARGTGHGEDYVNAAFTALPFAGKPIARVVGKVARAATPKLVQRGAKALKDFAVSPSYLKKPEAVQYALDAKLPYETLDLSPLSVRIGPSRSSAPRLEAPRYIKTEEGPFLHVSRTGVSPTIVPEAKNATSLQDIRAILANRETNPAAQAADEYNLTHFGRGYDLGMIDPGTSAQKQTGIARVFQEGVEGSPEYKHALFEAYGEQMPEVVEATGAQNYDQLTEAAYRQLAREAKQQFESLPVRTSYHYGAGEYPTPSAMLKDVLSEGNLNVFRGGDPHPFLSDVDPETSLTANEMFRAAHDFYGHGTRGSTFRPGGEELAYASHAQMMSPLAQMALLTETRGQNSLVNYSPLNIHILPEMAALKHEIEQGRVLARMRGERFDPSQFAEQNARLRELGGMTNYAPQEPLLLPPEYLDAYTAGGVPEYVQQIIKARAPHAPERAVHLSRVEGLTETDPSFYGTGHRGEDWRLRGVAGSPDQQTSFYIGPKGTVNPEAVVAENSPFAYEANLSGLYDIEQDPEKLVALARALSQGRTAIPDFARMVKEYGYSGYRTPNFESTPGQAAANVFEPVSLIRRIKKGKRGYSEGGSVSENPSMFDRDPS